MKNKDIVILDGHLGELVSTKKDGKEYFYFHPVGYGNYYTHDLVEVTSEDMITEATIDEKIRYIEEEFVWGHIVQTIHIPVSNIQVIEYLEKRDNKKVRYHVYIDFHDTNTCYETMDQALIGAVGYKHEGNNGRAAWYFMKMVGD